jgi:hypothetical protein
MFHRAQRHFAATTKTLDRRPIPQQLKRQINSSVPATWYWLRGNSSDRETTKYRFGTGDALFCV